MGLSPNYRPVEPDNFDACAFTSSRMERFPVGATGPVGSLRSEVEAARERVVAACEAVARFASSRC